MNPYQKFQKICKKNIIQQSKDKLLTKKSLNWIKHAIKFNYSYNFEWLGRPIIQYPQDILMMQEIIFRTKPEVIIETGIAHGGSLIFYASMLELLNLEKKRKRQVIGVDIDIRKHNLNFLKKHFLYKKIKLIRGSSIDKKIFENIKKLSKNKKTLIILDSNHTCDHVLKEMNLYHKLVSKNSYLIVFDTILEKILIKKPKDRPWHKGNSPMTAVKKFLKKNKNFKIEKLIDNKLLISAAPEGYLKKI